MDPVGPPISFASAVRPPSHRLGDVASARASYGGGDPIARIGPAAKPHDAPAAGPQVPDRPTADAGRLVGAKVSTGIDFTVDDTHPAVTNPRTASYAMYTRPADQNAAATNVDLGRTIDVTG